jgi:hypothetical protein
LQLRPELHEQQYEQEYESSCLLEKKLRLEQGLEVQLLQLLLQQLQLHDACDAHRFLFGLLHL